MSGEFMAVRREQLPAFPEHVVNDDFWLLCHLVRQGGRVVYEPAASLARGRRPGARARSARRTRMSAGRVMALSELRDLPPGFAWRALSHKYGRLALPFLLLGALLASLSLSRRRGYRALAAAQVACYATGALAVSRQGRRPAAPASWRERRASSRSATRAVALGVVRGAARAPERCTGTRCAELRGTRGVPAMKSATRRHSASIV